VQANEYEIVSVTLNEIVTNRVLVDTVTTQRLGVAVADDAAMENNPLASFQLQSVTVTSDTIDQNRFNGVVQMSMPGGLSISSQLTNYRYYSTNGAQFDPASLVVSKTMTTGNNFTMTAFGQGSNRTFLYFGSDSTTHTTIADNGLVRAQTFSGTLFNGSTLSSSLLINVGLDSQNLVSLHANGALSMTGLLNASQANVGSVVVQSILNVGHAFNVSNGSNVVLISNQGTVSASGLVQASSLSASTATANVLNVHNQVNVHGSGGTVIINNAGGLSVSSNLVASNGSFSSITASSISLNAIRASRFEGVGSETDNIVIFSSTRLSNVAEVNTNASNLRFNYSLSSIMHPGLSLVA
jgi:hypothetical protein